MARKIRIRGLRKEAWTVTPLAQVGPDADHDEGKPVLRDPGDITDGIAISGTMPEHNAYAIIGELAAQFSVSVTANQLSGYRFSFVDADFGPVTVILTGNTAALPGAACTVMFAPREIGFINENTVCLAFLVETVWFAKTGSSSNPGTRALPKATPQQAISAAEAYGKTLVACADTSNQEYECALDMNGTRLTVPAGITPTLKFPVEPFGESATGISGVVNQLAVFSHNGYPCIYAAANSGLYRSYDGKFWTLVHLSGQVVKGCCVWNGVLYAISQTTRIVYSVDESGSIDIFADNTHNQLGSSTVNGSIYVLGSKLYISVGDDPISAVWFDGTIWHVDTTDAELGALKQIIYDPAISERYAYGFSSAFGGTFVVIDMSNMVKTVFASIQPVSLTAHAGKLYGLTQNGIMHMVSESYPDIWTTVVERGPWYGYTQPRRMYWDAFGYIAILTGDDVIISKDNLALFTSYTYAGGIFTDTLSFLGVEVAAKTTGIVVWDRRHIRSAYPAVLSGYNLDGQDMALDTYAGDISLSWCKATGHARPCEDIAHTVTHAYSHFQPKNSSIGMRNRTGEEILLDHCEIVAAAGIGLRITGTGVRVLDCSIVANGRGLVLDAIPAEIARTIIWGNTIDIVSNVSGAVLTSCCYETTEGYPIADIVSGFLQARYIGNPLFVDDTGANLRLKSLALGYAIDSGILSNTATYPAQKDMRESIGARRYSRELADPDDISYGIDYVVDKNPVSITKSYQPASYIKVTSASGSIYGKETNAGAYKETRKLSWDSGFGAENGIDMQRQAAWLRYIHSIDSVFDVGETADDGITWRPQVAATKDANSDYNIVSIGGQIDTKPAIAPNQYAGAWCTDELGRVLGRINRHSEPIWDDVFYHTWTLQLVWDGSATFYDSTNECNIGVFRRCRVDKSIAFAPACPTAYDPDNIPELPSKYEMTFCEVDE